MADLSVRSLDLGDWALIELTGDDRLEWLQGQATNDVRGLGPGHTLSFCLCEPTGQLLSVCDAWALDDRILLMTARERADAVLERVERMTILEDVAVRLLSGQYAGVSIQGAEAAEAIASVFPLPERDAGRAFGDPIESPAFLLRSRRTLAGGWDLWVPQGTRVARQALDVKVPGGEPDWAEAARIAAGIPKWGVDMGPRTLPSELGPDFEARHVSYAKGCYTGQEVLMRMHSRGHTNRTWMGLVADAPMAVGEAVIHEAREVGRVSSSAPHPNLSSPEGRGAFLAAATLRNEATVEGTTVTVGEIRAEVRQMPIVRPA